MSIRPGFIVVLGVLALACVVAFGVTAASRAHDRREAQAATATAERLSPPLGATRSTECHGDNTVACFTVLQQGRDAAHAIARAMSAAASKPATVTCTSMSFGPAARQQTCLVSVRWGDHGTFASIDPTFVRVAGKLRITGAIVDVSTG